MSINTRGYTIAATLQLVTEECCNCGVTFAMPAEFRQQCLDRPGIDTGKPFYCPAGHKQWYTGKPAAQRERQRADQLARQLEAARARATHAEDQAAAAERSNRALRAVNTRTRKRIAAGICPCCRRSFTDLAQHMAGQHPDYAERTDG
ncbi:MAG: hypothetical protein ACRDT2_10150 [Natronosporangium sp.]